MQVTATEIPDVLRIDLRVHEDARGRFVRAFDVDACAAAGMGGSFVQENVTTSGEGVLRGLHFQQRAPQGKLVGVVMGAVFDVAVDLRVDSPTFGRWVGVGLDADQPAQVWVPPGFAHGFCVLRAPAVVVYRTTTAHDPDDQFGVRWDDPDLAISWPLEAPILSDRDRCLPTFAELRSSGLNVGE